METKEILKKVDMLNIDSRFNLIVASYFCAKVKTGDITEETIDEELARYQQKVEHFEFIKTSKYKAAYEQSGGIITVNKENNSEEIVPLIFMKIEEALSAENDVQGEYNSKNVLLRIKSFQKAMKLVQGLNLPCNDNYNDIYHILTQVFGQDGNALDDEISKYTDWKLMCEDADELFNRLVARGEKDSQAIAEIINLYRYKVLTDEENGIDITSESYKKSLQIVMEHVQNLSNSGYTDMSQCEGILKQLAQVVGIPEKKIEGIQTTNTDEANKIEEEKNNKLFDSIITRFNKEPNTLTREYIQKRVNELIQKKPDYDKRLSTLLSEFFLRSSIIYGWTKDDFEQRINSIDSTIQKMGFDEMDIDIGGEAGMGEISVNSKFYLNAKGKLNNNKDSLLNLARTFFHETGHCTDMSIREGVILRAWMDTAVNDNNIFYEWSNTVFERAIMGEVYEDESAMFLNHNTGYKTMANVGSMISAALGMNEIEFARLKDAGVEETMEFFDNRFAYYPNLYEKLKTTFMRPTQRSEGKQARKKLQKMYQNVYELCLDVLDARIEHDIQSGSVENSSEYQEQQRYFLKKINLNYQTASKKYGQRMEARKVIHKTTHTTDKIDKASMRKIGSKIRSESDFGFENDGLLEKIKSTERKPTLSERLKRRFGGVKLLEAGREEIAFREQVQQSDGR